MTNPQTGINETRIERGKTWASTKNRQDMVKTELGKVWMRTTET